MIFALDPAQVISLVIGVILPLLVGLVSRWNASASTRAVLLLALSAVSAFLTELVNAVTGHVPFDVNATLLTVLGTFLIGVGTHFGLWKPVGAATAVQQTGGFVGGSTAVERR